VQNRQCAIETQYIDLSADWARGIICTAAMMREVARRRPVD
jgi:hypothetical protein